MFDGTEVMVRFKQLYPQAKIFKKGRPYDACYDVHAGVQFAKCGDPMWTDETTTRYMPWIVPAGETKVIGTGISLELGRGYCGIVKGRSGLTSKGILVQLGTIETDYRGEIGVIIHNSTCFDWACDPFDRIAQFCVQPIYTIHFELDTTTPMSKWLDTNRGASGYGSSGMKPFDAQGSLV